MATPDEPDKGIVLANVLPYKMIAKILLYPVLSILK
jgi:hypothetical protein